MEFGIHLPQLGWRANRESVKEVAQRAEALGYESCWVSDHIAIPEKIETEYPMGGKFPVSPDLPWLDPLGTLCYAAACTERVRLGTSVLVLPWRLPVQTAKLIATLDQLSGGRTILGIGAGWMPEEFAAVGMPWDHRGARTDEQLEVFDALFTQERPEYHGKYYEFERIGFNPKPFTGNLTIWVGGFSPGAYRRAGRWGQGFHAAYGTPDRVAAQWAEVRREAEKQGRDPDSLTLSTRVWLGYGMEEQSDGSLWGSDEQMIDLLGRWAEIGMSHVVMDVLSSGGIPGRIESIERFAKEVRPKLG